MSFKFNPFTGNLDYFDASPVEVLNDLVNASSTKTIDTVPLTDFRRIDYSVALSNDSEGKTRSFDLTVINEGGTLTESVKDKLGKNINYAVNVSVNGGNLELDITNNEIFNIDVDYTKIAI